MKHFLLTWIASAVALLITTQVVPGFTVTTFTTALIAAAVIGLVNAIVRPILGILALPVTILTLGLFSFVLNALTLWLASALTPGYGFKIDNFIAALLGSIVLAIVSGVLNRVVDALD